MSDLFEFFERQLRVWPQAASRYEALLGVQTRTVEVGGFPVMLQHNPERAVSSLAKTDAASIARRPCFLCPQARPEVQTSLPMQCGYELLVNPFPIFPHHFTLPSLEHRPQDEVDLRDMGQIAQQLPGLVTFFNGSTAGASAPDHLHLQAGDKSFLPLVGILEANPGETVMVTPTEKIYDASMLPVSALHFVSHEVTERMALWMNTLMPAPGMRNVLMWTDTKGALHTLFIPRSAHRPARYFEPEGQKVSPGAVDMAGVLILPRREEYETLTHADIVSIYREVGYRYQEHPMYKTLLMS